MQDKQQIYGRNDMVMLEKHNKIYGSLGLTEPFVFDTINGENTVVLNNPKVGKFKDVVTDLNILGNSHQNSTTGKNLLSNKANDWNIGKGISWGGLIDSQIDLTNSTKNAVIEIPLKSSTTYFFINGKKDVLLVYRIIEKNKDGKGLFNHAFYSDESLNKDKYVFTTNSETVSVLFEIRIVKSETVTQEDIKNNLIMLAEGSVPLSYEPYTGGKPSPSPDYPQEIKNVGKWNEEKQKCEVDVKVTGKNLFDDLQIETSNTQTSYEPYKQQTITLTSDRPITKWDKLVEQDGQIGWLYKSKEITLNGSEEWAFYVDKKHTFAFSPQNKIKDGFCTHYSKIDSTDLDGKSGCFLYETVFLIISEPSISDVEGFKLFLSEKAQSEKPIKVMYNAEKYSEFIPLQQSEQDAIRALLTYYPTTVITVDGGELPVGIEVTYKQVNNG